MADTADINDLDDSDFAYIEDGGVKDASGKTVPRSLRHFPIQDAAHVRNALARLSSSPFGDKARAKVEAAAKKFGIGDGKALMPVKAQLFDPDEDKAFWAGKIPRRLLAIPFGGPIASPVSPIGVDVDGEYFDDTTDIYGPHRILRTDRERLVDFHHGEGAEYGVHISKDFPFRALGKTIIGKSILDPDPDEDGWWVDFWVKAGEKRLRLVKALSDRGAQLFGSSQAASGSVRPLGGGLIKVWPFYKQTISTSPQNTLSVMTAKATLDEINSSGIAISTAMTRLIEESADLEADLARASVSAKAGRELSGSNEAEIEAAIEEYESGQARMRALLNRIRDKYRKEPE